MIILGNSTFINEFKPIGTQLKKTEELVDDIQEQIQNMYDNLAREMLTSW